MLVLQKVTPVRSSYVLMRKRAFQVWHSGVGVITFLDTQTPFRIGRPAKGCLRSTGREDIAPGVGNPGQHLHSRTIHEHLQSSGWRISGPAFGHETTLPERGREPCNGTSSASPIVCHSREICPPEEHPCRVLESGRTRMVLRARRSGGPHRVG